MKLVDEKDGENSSYFWKTYSFFLISVEQKHHISQIIYSRKRKNMNRNEASLFSVAETES